MTNKSDIDQEIDLLVERHLEQLEKDRDLRQDIDEFRSLLIGVVNANGGECRINSKEILVAGDYSLVVDFDDSKRICRLRTTKH